MPANQPSLLAGLFHIDLDAMTQQEQPRHGAPSLKDNGNFRPK
jgi:hypothetical protein